MGKLEISNNDEVLWKTLTRDGTGDGRTIDIKDPNDSAKTVRTLTNNGDGTVTFCTNWRLYSNFTMQNLLLTIKYQITMVIMQREL